MLRIFKILLILSLISISCFFSLAQSCLYNDTDFESNGYLYHNLYWLRDEGLNHYAKWIFKTIPKNGSYITLKINALVTDITGGGWRPSAKLSLSYGEILSDKQNNIINKIDITLSNLSSIDDINQYWSTGKVRILKSELNSDASSLFIKIERLTENSNFVAFHKESIVIEESNEEVLINKFNRYTYWPIPFDQYLKSNRSKLELYKQNTLPDLWLNPEATDNHNIKTISIKQNEIKITSQIHNIGYRVAENVVLQFLVNNQLKPIGEKTIKKIWPESSYIRFIYWKIPSDSDMNIGDTIKITVIADPYNDILEMNKNNNIVEHKFLITE